jgi:uncharacterized protein (TIGR02172 family)
MEVGQLIGQGRTAEIFQWGEDKVLKLFRPGISKEIIENEYRVSSDINKIAKSTPKAYEFIEIENRIGIIYERIFGVSMMKLTAAKPWSAKIEAERLAETHKSIQQEVDFQLPKYKDILKRNIEKTKLLSEDTKIKLYKYMENLRDGNKLCHGDLHPDNILIAEGKLVVIDWMTATQGDPLADVARTSVILKYSNAPGLSYINSIIIKVFTHRFYSCYIKHYIKITGAKLKEIEEWELPIAAARLIEWSPEDEKKQLLQFINKKIRKLKY